MSQRNIYFLHSHINVLNYNRISKKHSLNAYFTKFHFLDIIHIFRLIDYTNISIL